MSPSDVTCTYPRREFHPSHLEGVGLQTIAMVVGELVRNRLGINWVWQLDGQDFGTAKPQSNRPHDSDRSVGKMEEQAMIITCTTELVDATA